MPSNSSSIKHSSTLPQQSHVPCSHPSSWHNFNYYRQCKSHTNSLVTTPTFTPPLLTLQLLLKAVPCLPTYIYPVPEWPEVVSFTAQFVAQWFDVQVPLELLEIHPAALAVQTKLISETAST